MHTTSLGFQGKIGSLLEQHQARTSLVRNPASAQEDLLSGRTTSFHAGVTCSSRKELDGEESGADTDSTAPPKPAPTAVAARAGVAASPDTVRMPPWATFRGGGIARDVGEVRDHCSVACCLSSMSSVFADTCSTCVAHPRAFAFILRTEPTGRTRAGHHSIQSKNKIE